MRVGVDTNVLVYAHLAGLPEHEAVAAYLHRSLTERRTVVALTPLVLHEFIHVITDARRFRPAVEMSEALALARGYLGKENVECLPVDEAAMLMAIDLLAAMRLGRKRVADTLLAATLLSHGIDRLVTCDVEHMSGFEGLTLIDPR